MSDAPSKTSASLTGCTGDAAILAAFDRRQDAMARYNALPLPTAGEHTAEEQAEMDVVNAAEAEIMAARATSPQGAAAQLWTALYYFNDAGMRKVSDVLDQGDFEGLHARGEQLDWGFRLALAAMRSLQCMEV